MQKYTVHHVVVQQIHGQWTVLGPPMAKEQAEYAVKALRPDTGPRSTMCVATLHIPDPVPGPTEMPNEYTENGRTYLER